MKKQSLRVITGLAGLLLGCVAQAAIVPSPPQVNARAYLLIDHTTGKVLAEGNADEQLAPASLTKMMTSYVVGKEIEAGNIKTDDIVVVSENAWAKNFPDSSKMFIEVGKEVSVEDLNRGIIIQSGNDACVAMAEHIAGSEDAFAELMNGYGQKIGMINSNFRNSHGLPDPDHYSSARDMAILAQALITDVPDEYAIYSEKSFTYNGIQQFNRNSLLWDKSMKVDGIKTGYTSEAGYSLVSSAVKANMRLIAVVMGTDSERARKVESKKLLNYGFRFYETITLHKAGESFTSQRVWMGAAKEVELGILSDTTVTVPRGQSKNLKANFKLDKELVAPISKGDDVGTVQFELDGEMIAEYPLVVLTDVEQGSLVDRMIDFVKMKIAN